MKKKLNYVRIGFVNIFCDIYNVVVSKEASPTLPQIDSSTIDGNVEFVHSQYSSILTSQVSTQFLCSTKLLIKVIILE